MPVQSVDEDPVLFYIVSYDISSNKLWRKIAKELENYGVRVQYSVFECDLDNDRDQEMYQKLIRLMNDIKEGSIRFYEVCSECRKKTHIIGIEKAMGKYNRDEVIVL